MEAMLEAMAEVYSKQLGENSSRGNERKRIKSDIAQAAQISPGYYVGEDKFLHIDEKTIAAVRYISFLEYASGKNKQEIANGFTRKALPPKRESTSTPPILPISLQNRMYIGDYNYKGEIERSCPAIIGPGNLCGRFRRLSVNKKDMTTEKRNGGLYSIR